MAQSEQDALPGLPEGYHEHEGADRGIGRQLRDIILGGQDGLVNVLGLVLGVAVATAHSQVIIVAGLAATFAESIAMAGVAYTSALADRDYYRAQLERETREIDEVPEIEKAEVRQIFREKGLKGDLLERVVQEITSDREVWLDVMMRDELHLTPVVEKGMGWRAFVTGISTLIGSLIPLVPFFFLPVVQAAFVAVPLAAVVLFAVGFYKAKTLVGNPYMSGLQMLLIGMVSALAGYLIGRLLHVSGGA